MPKPPMKSTPVLSGWRFGAGIVLLAIGWLCPLLIPLVTASGLSTAWKAMLSGFLLAGAPEVITVVAIIFLGKDGFNHIKARVLAFVKRAAPSARVSRRRYRIGLILLLPHLVFNYLIYYAPHVIPGYDVYRVPMNLTADALFIATLFVLGGDFWDKLRALFIYEARVSFPEEKAA